MIICTGGSCLEIIIIIIIIILVPPPQTKILGFRNVAICYLCLISVTKGNTSTVMNREKLSEYEDPLICDIFKVSPVSDQNTTLPFTSLTPRPAPLEQRYEI